MSSLTPQPMPVRRKGFEPDGSERWFVLVGGEQCGPFPAGEMAKRLDSGAIEWSSSVWRQGFRDWRPARRDAVLVTSVAGERGFASDTLRLHSAASFVVPEDTLVDHAPPLHDTTRLDGPPDFDPDDRSSSPPPPPMPREQAPRGGAEGGAPATPATGTGLSPSTILRVGPWTLRVPHSVISVAAVSFAAGVLAAALWARFLGRPDPIEVLVVPGDETAVAAAPIAAAAPVAEEAPSRQIEITPAAPDEPEPVEVPLEPTLPARELPRSAELRRAVREVAGPVRSCLSNAKRGVDVLLYLDGPSGRVRDVRIRRPRLGPVQARCVASAVRSLQVEPFRRRELAYPYRFAW